MGTEANPGVDAEERNVTTNVDSSNEEINSQTGQRYKNSNKKKKNMPKRVYFDGETEAMHGHVFQTFAESGNRRQFTKTVEALERYINKKLKFPKDMKSLTNKLKQPIVTEPAAITENDAKDRSKILIWKEDMKVYHKRKQCLEDNLMDVFAVIWGQCSVSVQAKVKLSKEYDEKKDDVDCAWLLNEVKNVINKLEGKRHKFSAIVEARDSVHNFVQKEGENNSNYFENFKSLIESFEHYGGTIGGDHGLLEEITDKSDPDHPGEIPQGTDADKVRKWIENDMKYKQKVAAASRDRTLGIMFLKKADRTRYGDLWTSIHNQYSRGTDQFPNDLTEAYNILTTHKREVIRKHAPKKDKEPPGESVQPGLSFLQQEHEVVAGTDDKVYKSVLCYGCKKRGHYRGKCPNANKTVGVNALQLEDKDDKIQYELIFTQVDRALNDIPDNWILLDSQSTVSVFGNKDFLTNIRKVNKKLTLVTNGGKQESDEIGDLRNFGVVWYNKESLANILSLAQVRKNFRVTMDTDKEPAMVVHRKDGSKIKFTEYSSGLYYYEVPKKKKDKLDIELDDYCFVTTVTQNKKMFTRREIEAADRARDLYAKIGRPSQERFEKILSENSIINCPVTVSDAKRVLTIYGPEVAVIKGRSTKQKPSVVPIFKPISLPSYILKYHRVIQLAADFFYVQGLVFLLTKSRKIKLLTVTGVDDRTKETQIECLGAVIKLYEDRGFDVANVITDKEFEHIRNDLSPINLETVATDDHVGDIEVAIRHVKEDIRCTVQSLPYNRYTKLMIRELVSDVVRKRNMFPAVDGVSDKLSPLTIVNGDAPPDYNKMKLEFGSYVQAFEENEITNNTNTRAIGAIALSTTPNNSGEYRFMCLNTGRPISRRKYKVLPITNLVIKRINELAIKEKQPAIQGETPLIEWRPGVPVDDVDFSTTDMVPVYDNNDNTEMVEVPVEDIIAHDDEQEDNILPPEHVEEPRRLIEDGDFLHNEVENAENENMIEPVEQEDLVVDNVQDADEANDLGRATANDEPQHDDNLHNIEEEDETQERDNPSRGRYNLRGNKRNYGFRLSHQMDDSDMKKSYGTQFTQVHTITDFEGDMSSADGHRDYTDKHIDEAIVKADSDPKDLMNFVTHYIFLQMAANLRPVNPHDQMSAKKGIKKFGTAAVEALIKEFAQLIDLTVFEGLVASDLTPKWSH